jgi:hypothetical protein
MTDRETNTLAARGLEELFFQLCYCVSFFVLTGNRFWCYILTYLEYNTHNIVLVFWFWWDIVFAVTYYMYLVLSVQYSCAGVSVLLLWREIVLKMRTPFNFLWAVSTKNAYWVTLLWFTSRCVYFARPNTLVLCIFLFCIFLLYRTDQQVEVQIRILLNDKFVK